MKQPHSPGRREFLQAATAAATAPLLWATPKIVAAAPTPTSPAETAIKALYDSLTEAQKKAIVFDWNHIDPKRGKLRTFISANWQITDKPVLSDFYTKSQQGIIYDIYRGLISPEWHERSLKQIKDDNGGPWGSHLAVALFGEPGSDKFQFVLSGRHLTLRADGNTEPHVVFGGPIVYGHAPKGNEDADHAGNVFWSQAQKANGVYQLLNEKQRKQALVAKSPRESAVEFRGKSPEIPGLLISELSPDVKAEMQKVLLALLEPYRTEDRDEALSALKAQGGLDAARLSFFADEDIGDDQVWDNWRLEGPAFVWHYRGSPHLHAWINIADDPSANRANR